MLHASALRVCLFFVVIAGFPKQSRAQQVTVINQYAGDSTGTFPQDFVLRSFSEQTYIINRFERVPNTPGTRLRTLVDFSHCAYLENAFSVEDGTIVIRKSPDQVITDLQAILVNAIWLYDFSFDKDFGGYSSKIRTLCLELERFKGYEADFNQMNDLNLREQRVGFFFFQQQLLALKEAVEEETAAFFNAQPVLNESPGAGASGLVQETPVKTSANPIEEDPYLDPLDFELQPDLDSETGLLTLQPDDNEILAGFETSRKPRSKRRAFEARMVELMAENNRLLANYGKRFDVLERDVAELKAGTGGGNAELRQEVDELKQMVAALAAGQTYRDESGSGTRPLNVEPVQVLFDRNSAEITPDDKLALNRVIEVLARNPRYRVLITGHADATGNADYNLMLSEERAMQVRAYLERAGVARSRMLVNFYGSRQSESLQPNPGERRVEVEWLVDFPGTPQGE